MYTIEPPACYSSLTHIVHAYTLFNNTVIIIVFSYMRFYASMLFIFDSHHLAPYALYQQNTTYNICRYVYIPSEIIIMLARYNRHWLWQSKVNMKHETMYGYMRTFNVCYRFVWHTIPSTILSSWKASLYVSFASIWIYSCSHISI